MEIRLAKKTDLEQIYEFNHRLFPGKKINSKEYINFWVSKSPEAINKFVLLLDDHKKIVGQTLSSSMSYYYKNTIVNSIWLFELIIEKGLRKSAWGIDLLLKCLDEYPTSCSTGSGPKALPIHLKLGNTYLGDIKKYGRIINPIFFLTSHKKSTIDNFPKSINYGAHTYYKVEEDNLPNYNTPFNENLLEISRQQKFLKWRFFNNLHKYSFYLRNDNQTYLVLRSITQKGIRLMEMVDFRCKNNLKEFEEIYQVAKKITIITHLPVLLCGSSLATFDKVLESHHFKLIGRPRPILGFVKCKDRQKEIENRNFCFVTFADSDGETNWT